MSGGRVADALRSLRWPQARAASLFGLVMCALTILIDFTSFKQWAQEVPTHLIHLRLFGEAIDFQIKAFVLLVAVVIADREVDDGAPRRKTYVLAALIGCSVGVLISELFSVPWRFAFFGEYRSADRPWLGDLLYWPIRKLAIWLLLGAPAVLFYADRRAAMKTAALLHAAELDRVRRSRIALESRLQAMQARVEPQFLFNTLDQVEHLYAQDPALGGRMLDDLIAYLRAAMPLMRDTSSTVAQELELARSHLDIAKMRLGNRLAFDIEVPAGLGSARLPPMMLLPLLDHALRHEIARSGADGAIRIGVGVEAGRLSLRIAASGAGFVPDAGGDGIASIRERLHALYGSAARLGLRIREGGGTEAVIDIPHEIAAAAA